MSRRPPYVYGSHVDNAVARTARDGWWTAAALGVAIGALLTFAVLVAIGVVRI